MSQETSSDVVVEASEEVEKPKPRRAPRRKPAKVETEAETTPTATTEEQPAGEQSVAQAPQSPDASVKDDAPEIVQAAPSSDAPQADASSHDAKVDSAPAEQAEASDSAESSPAAVESTHENVSRERGRAPQQSRPQRQQRRERPDGDRQSHDGHRNNGRSRGGQYRERERDMDLIQRDGPSHNILDLMQKEMPELQELARSMEVQNPQRYKKADLMNRILQAQTEAAGYKWGEGVLDVIEDGFGFLRGERYLPGQDDIYVSQSQIRRFGLRTGDKVAGQIRPPKDNEKFHSLLRVEAVNGLDPETARRRPNFDTLTPIFPLELIDLETQPHILSTRLVNLVAPIGRGQRGLIVSPPKAGKTIILKAIANGITTNCSDIHLIVCLIGERPEEVTDMKRSVDGEVVSSTFDEPVEDHTKVAEMVLERAKRLVEGGRDVVILLDSITRLARAYNLAVPPSGRTLSGGIDPIALYPPKRFFGAARNIEGGGSLTIIATCLVDTGSRMDDVIYEEFKGTGNMELHLDRKLAERRIYPAIDIQRSGTRREDLLLDENALRQVYTMRRMVSMLGGTEGTELVVGRLAKTQNNAEFLVTLTKDI